MRCGLAGAAPWAKDEPTSPLPAIPAPSPSAANPPATKFRRLTEAGTPNEAGSAQQAQPLKKLRTERTVMDHLSQFPTCLSRHPRMNPGAAGMVANGGAPASPPSTELAQYPSGPMARIYASPGP